MPSVVHSGALAALKLIAKPYSNGPLPEWQTFARSTHLITVEARAQVPTTSRDIYVVVKGLVKLVSPGPEAKVEEFFEAVSIVGPQLRPSWAQHSRTPLSISSWRSRHWGVTAFNAVAIERSQLLRLDYRVIEVLADRHTEWGQVHSAFLWTYIESLYSALRREDNVEQQYRDMLENRAGLLRRLTQRDLASYLNVTESALSRIAKRVRENPDGTAPDEASA